MRAAPRTGRRRGWATTRSSRRSRCFAAIESLPFAPPELRAVRPAVDQPRADLGGDALNKVPDTCVIDVDMRFLPEQDPEEILEAGRRASRDRGRLAPSGARRPWSSPSSPFVRGLCEAASPHHPGEVMSVGRDGASDAVSFLRVGVPAVEFGPVGDGHHGPEEWVSVASLRSYRQALVDFVNDLRRDSPRRPTERGEARGTRRRRAAGPTADDEGARRPGAEAGDLGRAPARRGRGCAGGGAQRRARATRR